MRAAALRASANTRYLLRTVIPGLDAVYAHKRKFSRWSGGIKTIPDIE